MYLIYLDGTYFGAITANSEEEAFNFLKTRYIKLIKSDSTLSRFEDKKNYDGWEWQQRKNNKNMEM